MAIPQGAAYTRPFQVLDVAAFIEDFKTVDDVTAYEIAGTEPRKVQLVADDGFWPAFCVMRNGEDTQLSLAEVVIPHLPADEIVVMLCASFQGPRSVNAEGMLFDASGHWEEFGLHELIEYKLNEFLHVRAIGYVEPDSAAEHETFSEFSVRSTAERFERAEQVINGPAQTPTE